MEEFSFDYHTFATAYPDSGTKVQLGNSYEATTEPVAPDQRLFQLEFPEMRYQCLANGEPDLSYEPGLNLHLLDAFYRRHKLWKSFQYRHPAFGLVVVKFNKPLQIPKANKYGWVRNLQIEFKEQP